MSLFIYAKFICVSFITKNLTLSCVILTSKNKNCAVNEIKKILWTKRPIEEKMINCHFQRLHKITCQIKQSQTSLSFSLLIDCCMSFFSCLKAYVNLEKLIKFYRQAFIICKNGENLKILKEISRQKLKFLALFWSF